MPSPVPPSLSERFDIFRQLHQPGRPLFLPNAWDFASAAALVQAGFAAIGTTSLGVAAAAGKPDAAAAGQAETLALTWVLNRLPSLLTVDIEAGFSDDPVVVAELAAELVAAGAVGVNLEDGQPGGVLGPAELHQEKIAAIRSRVPDLFINARTDTCWLADHADHADLLEETVRRAVAYRAAGADGIFVPGVADPGPISTLVAAVDAPLNVLYAPGRHTVAELAQLGVARVSTGSLLFRTALGAAVDAAGTIRDGKHPGGFQVAGYAEVQRLTTAW